MNGSNDRTSRRYSPEEVSRIIKRAFKPGGENDISYRELQDIARDLGVNPASLDEAIHTELADRDIEEARARYVKHRRSTFTNHLWSFGIVIGFLMLINIFTGGGWWFQWPLLGWGVGLAFHFRATYFPTEQQIDRGAYRMLTRSKRSTRRLARELRRGRF